MGTRVGPPKWKAEGIASADLVRGYPGGKRTPASAVPPHLGRSWQATSCGQRQNL